MLDKINTVLVCIGTKQNWFAKDFLKIYIIK